MRRNDHLILLIDDNKSFWCAIGSSVSLFSLWQSDPHACPLSWRAFDHDRPAVGFHQVSGDRQPQPHSA